MKLLIIFFKSLFLLLTSLVLFSCDKKPEVRNSIALNYLVEGDTAKAIQQLNKAIQDKPDYIEAIINRGKIYSSMRKFDAALDDFDKVLSLQEDNHEAIKGRGIINLELKQFEFAIKDLNAAIKNDKNDANLYLFRAYSFFEIDLLIMACEDWQNASELGSVEADKYLAEFCSQIKEEL